LIEQGYLEGKINGREAKFENPPDLEKNLRHDIDVRIDRLKLNRANRQRLTEAIEAGTASWWRDNSYRKPQEK
jgi:excinuclease ABC subunit A